MPIQILTSLYGFINCSNRHCQTHIQNINRMTATIEEFNIPFNLFSTNSEGLIKPDSGRKLPEYLYFSRRIFQYFRLQIRNLNRVSLIVNKVIKI